MIASVKKWLQKWGNQRWAGKSHQMKVKGKIKLNGGFSRPSLPKGQSFFFGSSESKYGIWWPGDPQQPCAWLRERWHRSSFPMDFPSLGEVIRDVQETSSEIQKKMTWNSDIFLCQLKHLGTSWKIFVYHVVFFSRVFTFIAVVAGSHGAQPWDSREYLGQTLQVRSW